MTESVTIDRRFHGPPCSGNGGYSCGLLGGFIDGPAAVRLRIPPPLDTPMEVRKTDPGIELFHKDEMVASGRSTTVEIEIPEPPDFAGARRLQGRGYSSACAGALP